MAKVMKPLTNRTSQFFYTICKLMYLTSATHNYWFQDLDLSKTFVKIVSIISKFIHIWVYAFILCEWAAFFTQKHLTDKQKSDRIIFSLSHPVFMLFVHNLAHHKDELREIMRNLTVELKDVYNDTEVEMQMMKKVKFYEIAFGFLFSMALASYGLDGLTANTFTTVIPAWPDVIDTRALAGFARLLVYITWWVLMLRVSTVYIILIATTIALASQYKLLGNYYRSLNGIFEKNISHEEKENEYERGFKVGIKLHSDTLACTRRFQNVFNLAFGGQILINVSVLVLLMYQMVSSERTLATTVTIVTTTGCLLLNTGFFMWNAGDVTVEASHLPTAMFSSGWHNCQKTATRRIRPLLVVAMSISQCNVEVQCLGILTLSYSSYVTIVKSSYSLFSVIY